MSKLTPTQTAWALIAEAREYEIRHNTEQRNLAHAKEVGKVLASLHHDHPLVASCLDGYFKVEVEPKGVSIVPVKKIGNIGNMDKPTAMATLALNDCTPGELSLEFIPMMPTVEDVWRQASETHKLICGGVKAFLWDYNSNSRTSQELAEYALEKFLDFVRQGINAFRMLEDFQRQRT
jgi:hypothetical protein